jgi:hypothetical protein
MANWMQAFLKEFPNISERITGTRQDLEKVESLLSDARQTRTVSADTLQTIEQTEHWNYPAWWPFFSQSFGEPISLPQSFLKSEDRKRAVDVLYDRLRHIEVVSVVLRFIFPEDFGIISPPVGYLLNLPSQRDHISYYMHYLDILGRLRDHGGLKRIADVDMALWTASNSQHELPAIAELMYRDEYFQEIRLKNIFAGLRGIHAVKTELSSEKRQAIEHLLIARAWLAYDHVLAALICGRTYESLVDMICSSLNIQKRTFRTGDSDFLRRCERIAQAQEFAEYGYSFSDLKRWWDRRVKAAHPENKISRREAEDFVMEVSALCARLFAPQAGLLS